MFRDIFQPFVVGLAATAGLGLLIGLTRRWHGASTADRATGPQKFHRAATPRIGGLAVYAGFWLAAAMAPPPERGLLFAVAASAALAFAAGLLEDVARSGRFALRLFCPLVSAAAFCLATSYAVTRVDALVVDRLTVPALAIAFTAVAMACFTQAMNVIDGFHGLATGTAILMLVAFAVVSFGAGDRDLALFCCVAASVFLGFLLVNFPFGYVFLGDGGAYFLGFVVASAAVMVPTRNEGVSPWVSVVVLAYPLLETAVAVVRKVRRGRKPHYPDRLHLHMLVYRRLRKRLSGTVRGASLANPATGMLLWGFPASSLGAVLLMPPQRKWCVGVLALQALLYAWAYRKAAPKRPHLRDAALRGRR